MYTANAHGSVSQFELDTAGNLTALSPPTVPTAEAAVGIAVTPDAKSVYVASETDLVTQYSIGADGALATKSPATVPAAAAKSIIVSPDGRSAYVPTSLDRVEQFDIAPDGRLSPKSPANVVAGSLPRGIAISPNGRNAYVANDFCGFPCLTAVSQYSVDLGGHLAPLVPPFASGFDGPSFAHQVAISPDGASAYVTGAGGVAQYTILSDGRLQPKLPPFVTAPGASDVIVSPDGKSAYVTDEGGSVYQFNVDATGLLSFKVPFRVAASRFPGALAMTTDGRRLFVADESADIISQFDVNASGQLTVRTTYSLPRATQPEDIPVTPQQKSPTSKDECKNGGWRAFGDTFKNQGQCVAFVERGPKP